LGGGAAPIGAHVRDCDIDSLARKAQRHLPAQPPFPRRPGDQCYFLVHCVLLDEVSEPLLITGEVGARRRVRDLTECVPAPMLRSETFPRLETSAQFFFFAVPHPRNRGLSALGYRDLSSRSGEVV